MQIEATHEADVVCKALISEAYEAAYAEDPSLGGFSGLDKLWEKIEEVLARKGALDLCTTGVEDSFAQTILGEAFEQACRTADEERFPTLAFEYVDYKALWERICGVLEVSV